MCDEDTDTWQHLVDKHVLKQRTDYEGLLFIPSRVLGSEGVEGEKKAREERMKQLEGQWRVPQSCSDMLATAPRSFVHHEGYLVES